MVASEDRKFPTYARGTLRDDMLAWFRTYLRSQVDPDTGVTFEESDIQAATSDLSRFWSEADNLDLALQAGQQRAQWLADQAHPLTASDKWLRSHHATLWQKVGPPLDATSGGGTITWAATPGTVFVGSTTRPDGAAHKIRVGAYTFQVLYTEVTPASGIATLKVRGLETGFGTNVAAGSAAVPQYPPPGALPTGITIAETFSGGAPAESARDYGRRIIDFIRRPQGAGNPAQIRSWARKASTAIEDGFIYSCALECGSVVVCVLQKRGDGIGPLARIAGATVVADATAYLTPPGSPVMPVPPQVLVVTAQAVTVDTVARLRMARGSRSGWADPSPWPANTTTAATITTVTSQTLIRVTVQSGVGAPQGQNPAVMVWNALTSRFVPLVVLSVATISATVYELTLAAAPAMTLATGQYVSPGNNLAEAIALSLEDYHDSLGPGEIVDLATSTLAHRAFRFPPPEEEWDSEAGTDLAEVLRNELGGASSNETIVSQSVTTPAVPADPADGPRLLVAGRFAVYPR